MNVSHGPLISAEYQAQQKFLHENTHYGTAAKHYGALVTQIVDNLQVSHLLDYGCGSRMSLLQTLKPKGQMKYQGYDPGTGIAELATAPIPAQMVCCIDVLEHIEPEYLDNVLDHLATLTEAVAFLTIHTGPAQKILPDGRNAHLIQQPIEWWLPKIMARWDLQTAQRDRDNGFYVIAYAKPRLESPDGSKLVA